MTSTPLKACPTEATKEATWPNATHLQLWWRPKTIAFVLTLQGVCIVALNTMLVWHLSQTLKSCRSNGLLIGWHVQHCNLRMDQTCRFARWGSTSSESQSETHKPCSCEHKPETIEHGLWIIAYVQWVIHLVSVGHRSFVFVDRRSWAMKA